jgi:tRNA pseudouridine13 synthase
MNPETSPADSQPRIRVAPEDFMVDEIPLYPPSGEGGHTFVRIEKRLRNTEDVAEDLARAAGISGRDVGYAGRKDRLAVTRQWFSVPDLDPERALALDLEGARVLEAHRHGHKLRTAQLRGNRFEIRVRDVNASALARAHSAVELIREFGLPNRFGSQRFGRQGDNARRARSILKTGRVPGKRRQARFLLSALQAEVFNRILSDRPLPINVLERGDLAMKHDSGGVFEVEDEARENERAACFEISPTGPIFGSRASEPSGAPGIREARALAELEIPNPREIQLPRGIRLRGARRSLRILPTGLEMLPETDALLLRFELPSGSYATVLLEELFGELAEGERPKNET